MDNIIEELNKELQNTEFSVEAVLNLKAKLEAERVTIRNKLESAVGNDSDLTNLVSNSKAYLKIVNNISDDVDDFEEELGKYKSKIERVRDLSKGKINEINLLEKSIAYFEVLRQIDDISNEIASNLNDRGNKDVSHYTALCSLSNAINKTACSNLRNYLSETLKYWHCALKNRYSTDFEELIKNLKWPFIGSNILFSPSQELIGRFQSAAETLIHIQLPQSLVLLDSGLHALSLPIASLVRPLKKRFLFHFSGSRQTNQAEKPEWYFTQILTWIKDHQEFVDKVLQPVYDKINYNHVEAKVEFMRGLVEIAMEKLHWDLPHLQYDDVLFSHTVDEALGFARELQDSYGYPDTQPTVLSVLTQAHFFVKWIHLEKKYSLEKLDVILRSNMAFKQIQCGDEGEWSTECVDKFLVLLSTITARYSNLPQPGHRLQFLQLQLDLIDDFRVRLLQLLRNEEEDCSVSPQNILNSISCLKSILQEWAEIPHFLHLQFYKQQLEDKEEKSTALEGGIFDNEIQLFDNMEEKQFSILINGILMEVKTRSRPYRKFSWHAMYEIEDGVTPVGIEMFQALTTGLCDLNNTLTPRLRQKAFHMIAAEIDEFLYEELVLLVFFSSSGALRFSLDVRRNLIPVFGQYMTKPQTKLPRLCDACTVLTLASGSAMLLKEALSEHKDKDISDSEVLLNLGVLSLSANDVLAILKRRTDL